METTDNKIRLSPDAIAKADAIAQTWGLKNSRAAIEAVFRKYADDYLQHCQPNIEESPTGGEVPDLNSVRCECRRGATGEAVAIWHKGDGG